MCSLVLLLTIFLQLVASYSHSKCLPSLLVLCLHSYALRLQSCHTETSSKCQVNFGTFQESGESRFGGSEKDLYFLKTRKWQHKLLRDYKRGKLASYFLNNVAKTCLHALTISENIEIEHAFQSKAIFHLSSNFHTSCLNAFKLMES